MGIFDYFKNRREQKKMQEEYATLDNGQLQVALAEMYERLMFIGKSIKDKGEVIYDLSSDAKNSWEVDNFEMRMNALLGVVKNRLVDSVPTNKGYYKEVKRKVPSARKAKFLDFKGANPKLAKMEAKLMGYGMAFQVPEMDKFFSWRDGQDFIQGSLTLKPFSQHSSRYHNSIATKKDLLEISSPQEIKEKVMSQADIDREKAEMAKQEYLGGAFVNVVDSAWEIAHRLNLSTEYILDEMSKKGIKRSDILSVVKEMVKSDDFQRNDSYIARSDMLREKYPQICEVLGSHHEGSLVQLISGISEHKGYMPAILNFLNEAKNFDKNDLEGSSERLAEYMRRQHRGELSDFTDKKSVHGALKAGNEKATSLARLGRSDSLGLKRKELPSVASVKSPRANTTKAKSSSMTKAGESR